MKKLITICAVVGILLYGNSVSKASPVFNAPGFTYTKVIDGGSRIYSSASFSPDGTKIAYIDRTSDNSATYYVKLYDRSSGNTSTIATGTRNGTGKTGFWGFTTPYFSDDGTKIGWTNGYYDQRNDLQVYTVSGGTTTTYTPPAGTSDVSNSDFLGSYSDQWVAWDWHNSTGEADLYLYSATVSNWTQGTNLTSSTQYSDYEPDSDRLGNRILYWSGETSTEPIDTTHTLTFQNNAWVKDVSFNAIPYSTWAFWSRDESRIGLTKYDSDGGYGKGDLYVYDKNGNFVLDLTGPSVGQDSYWQYFGFNFKVGSEYLFTSGADNILGGRDIWIAVPEPATMSLLGLGALSLLRRKR